MARRLAQTLAVQGAEVLGQKQDVVPAFAQGWDVDGEDRQPLEEIWRKRPASTRADRSWLVAATTRALSGMSRFDPSRRKLRLSSTRSSFP